MTLVIYIVRIYSVQYFFSLRIILLHKTVKQGQRRTCLMVMGLMVMSCDGFRYWFMPSVISRDFHDQYLDRRMSLGWVHLYNVALQI